MRLLLPVLLSAPFCHGAIVVSGDIQTTGGSFEITTDITIEVTVSGQWGALVFDSWVTHDGSQNGVGITPDSISYSLNGGTPSTVGTISLVDNTAGLGDVGSGSGFVAFGAPGISVSAGDTLTILANSYGTGANSSWNPSAIQTFTGEVFLADTSWNRISGNLPVPEPASSTLILLGALAALARPRRRF